MARKNRATVFIRAYLPENLEGEWLHHVREFDRAHPDCHFEVMTDTGVKLADAVEMVKAAGLTFTDIF